MMYPNPAVKIRSNEEREGVLEINAPRFELDNKKQITINNGKIIQDSLYETTINVFDEFLKKHLTLHPIKEFHVSSQRMEDGKVSLSLWWESQNIFVGDKMQQYFTKYAPTVVFNGLIDKQHIQKVFHLLRERLPKSNEFRNKYVEQITEQENTTLVLTGFKRAMSTIHTQILNHTIVQVNASKIREDGVQLNGMEHVKAATFAPGQRRGEGTIPDLLSSKTSLNKKETPVEKLTTVLDELDEEIANPEVKAGFVDAGVREKTFLKFIVSIASHMRNRGTNEGLWKFYAKKFTDMISNFFGVSLLKNESNKSAFRALWHKIQATSAKLAKSSVLDRMIRLSSSKGPLPKSFEERAAATRAAMFERLEREKRLKSKSTGNRKVGPKNPIEENLITTSPIQSLESKPVSMWDRIKSTTKKLFGR